MGQRVIDKITRLAPNFEGSIIRHTTFTPKHMGVMFGAPGGDYCHGLLNPDQIGPNRSGPKGFLGQPIPTGCTWAVRVATGARGSLSSPVTTPVARRWPSVLLSDWRRRVALLSVLADELVLPAQPSPCLTSPLVVMGMERGGLSLTPDRNLASTPAECARCAARFRMGTGV
jgi:hypothetical protein